MSVNTWGVRNNSENEKLERVNANASYFRWKLEKFSSIDRLPDRCLISGAFTATGCGIFWRMKLYPNGKSEKEYNDPNGRSEEEYNDPNGRSEEEYNDFMTVGVDYTTHFEAVTVTFELSVVNNDGEVMEEYKLTKENLDLLIGRNMPYPGYVSAGFYRLKLRRSNVENPNNHLLKDDCLTISLDVTYNDPIVVPSISNEKEIQSSQKKIFKEFEKLLNNGEFSDVTFTVGDKQIRAHKAILAVRSPVFEAMFLHDMQEKEKNVVKIVDIEYAVLMELFRFLYTGAVGNIEEVATSLLMAAEKYCIERLKSLCVKTLLDNLKIDNAIHCFAAADACNIAGLRNEAFDFILNHADEVVERDEFTSLSTDLMRELFRALVKKIPKESI